MIQVNEAELLQRAQIVQEKADVYKELIFQHEIFKHKSKAYLASLKMELKKMVIGKVSDVELETSALALPSWNQYLEKELGLLKQAGRAKVELEAAMVRYESMRSALSSRRAEVKSFGG